jgi:hypothetical protein
MHLLWLVWQIFVLPALHMPLYPSIKAVNVHLDCNIEWNFNSYTNTGRNISPDDSSSISIYENFENSLRDSSSSNTAFEGSIHGGNEHCDIQAIIIPEQGESETECSEINNHEDNNYSGVFTIRIPTHHLIREEQPCIMIETNSHSEAW